MPLLDGKYEILSERPAGRGATRFEGTDPQGGSVRIVYYDLRSGDEVAFERYRRLLKSLARSGSAAVVDVVSRPGARYVVWRSPGADFPRATDDALEASIRLAGFDPSGADVRRDDRETRLFDLRFQPETLGSVPTEAHDTSERLPPPRVPPRRRLAARLAAVRLTNVVLSWLIAAGLLGLAVSSFAGGFVVRANDRVVRVPDLIGNGVHEVVQRLVDIGLRVEAVAVGSERESGVVLTLDPPPGSSLRPGRSVRLTYAVSAGHLAPVVVPAVVGAASTDVAIAPLEAVGLRLGHIGRVHADAPAGQVLAQSVPAGSTLGQGQGVDLVVSLGPRQETTFLPDLVGLPLEDARYLVTVAGLTNDQLVVEHVTSERGRPGTVLSQSLAPFARVPRAGATLRLLVVAEPAPFAPPAGLPSLAGLELEQARTLAAGFDVRVETIEDRTLPAGVVLQSLPAGAQAGDGPLVLTVNVRPVPVPRPDVRAIVREPALRTLSYTWFIEPGIPTQTAEVRARTLRGDDVLVQRQQVRGGETLHGTWTTTAPGPVRFTLTLNREPYGGDLLVP